MTSSFVMNLVTNKHAYSVARHDWMRHLDLNLKLSEITIPGTHCSATYNFDDSMNHIKHQNYSLREQLHDGIRFLDIQLACTDPEDYSLSVIHDRYHCQINFEQVLLTCKSFLLRHPTEVICIQIMQRETKFLNFKRNFMHHLEKFLTDDNKAYYYQGDINTTLHELKGKIVFFNHCPTISDIGIPCQSEHNQYANHLDQDFRILPQHSHTETAKQIHSIKKMIDEAASTINDTLYISYNCIQTHSETETPYDLAWGNGLTSYPVMNKALMIILESLPKHPARLGVVLLDYYHNMDNSDFDVTKNLIEINLKYRA